MARRQLTARARRRAAAAGAVAGVLLTLLVANVGGAPSEACEDPGVLRVATGDDVSASGVRRALISRWPGVELVEVSRVADLKHAEMLAATQADPCTAYDVLILDTAWTAEFAAAGLLREIDDVPAGLVPQALATGDWRGAQYALPFATDVGLLYRRKGLPEPRTWQELWSAARTARNSGYDGGLMAQLDDFEGATVGLLEMVRGTGADVVDGDGDVVLDEPPDRGKVLDALRLLWHAQRDTVLAGSWTAKEAESLAAFSAGKVAYLRHWPYAFLQLTTSGTPFEVSRLPGSVTLGGSNLAITARTDKYDKALDFIKYLISEPSQRQLFSCGGYAPVVAAAYHDVTACGARAADGAEAPTRQQLQHLADVIGAALPSARRPSLEHYTSFSEVFRDCVKHAAFDDAEPSPAFAARLADELRAARAGVLSEREPCR